MEARSAIGDDWLVHRWVTAADEPTLLLIGLIQRAPHLSRDSFASYWWSSHRPLANRLVPAELNPHAYVHNYVLADQPSPWDGIGELYEQSLHVASQRGEWFESEAAAPLTQDEERFMISSTRQVLVTDHRILIGCTRTIRLRRGRRESALLRRRRGVERGCPRRQQVVGIELLLELRQPGIGGGGEGFGGAVLVCRGRGS